MEKNENLIKETENDDKKNEEQFHNIRKRNTADFFDDDLENFQFLGGGDNISNKNSELSEKVIIEKNDQAYKEMEKLEENNRVSLTDKDYSNRRILNILTVSFLIFFITLGIIITIHNENLQILNKFRDEFLMQFQLQDPFFYGMFVLLLVLFIFFIINFSALTLSKTFSLSELEEKKLIYKDIKNNFFIGNIFFLGFLLTKNYSILQSCGLTLAFNLLTIIFYTKTYKKSFPYNLRKFIDFVSYRLLFSYLFVFTIILGLHDLSIFLENFLPYANNSNLYSYYEFVAHLYLLCLSIIVMTFYEDLTVPYFIFLFQLGIFLKNYNQFDGSYKIYFIFFVLSSIIVIYYTITFIIKRKESQKQEFEEEFSLQENYGRNHKSNTLINF